MLKVTTTQNVWLNFSDIRLFYTVKTENEKKILQNHAKINAGGSSGSRCEIDPVLKNRKTCDIGLCCGSVSSPFEIENSC